MIERVTAVGHGAEATAALRAAVAQAQAGRPLAPVTVVVPSNFAGLAARHLLGAGGVANVGFVTPFRLAELLSADLLLDTRPLTNPVLGAAVRAELAHDPGPFAASAEHHSTERAVAALFGDITQLPASVRSELRTTGPVTARTIDLIERIEQRLTAHHHEAHVARAASGRPDLGRAVEPLGHVIWYLPSPPLSTPLVDVVAAVLVSAPSSVVVGLTGAAGADRAVLDLVRRAGAPEVSADGRPPPVADEIVSVTDADEEVRAVVRRVVGLLESGIEPHRIAVFVPAPEPYGALLERHLADAGVPSNGPARRSLAATVAGRTLLAAFDLPQQRWRRDKVMRLFSDAPVRAGGAPTRPGSWEVLSRQAGVVGGRRDWAIKLAQHQGRLQHLLDRSEPAPTEAEREQAARTIADLDHLARAVAELGEHLDAIHGAPTWSEMASAAHRLLVHLLGPGHTHGWWPEAEQAAFERVEDAIARVAALDEIDPHPTADVFRRALAAELDTPADRRGRFGHGVFVGPLASAVGLDLDAVFVVGMSEGLCPGIRADDAVLPDSARALTGGHLPLRADRLHDQHRAYLAALAAAPPGSRTITFPRGDLRRNRSAVPSRWLLDSASARAGRRIHGTELDAAPPEAVTVIGSHLAGVTADLPHLDLAERDLAELWHHHTDVGPVVDHPVAAGFRRGLVAAAARRSADFTEWDGNLGASVSVPTTPMSPTRLETWASCGFRYFLGQVLGLAERDDPERVLDLSPLDRGSAVHDILERFIAAVLPQPPSPDEPWSAADHERVRVLADAVLAEYEARGRTGRALRWRSLRADLLAGLDEFLDVDNAFRQEHRATPEAVEVPFGLRDTEPVVLELAGGRRLSFRGVADRVDHTEQGRTLVSDYKTGRGQGYRQVATRDPFQAGTTLQLGLYAEAAIQRLGATEVASHYWMVERRGEYQRYGYDWTAERRARFHEVLQLIVDGIGAGAFPAVPGEWESFFGSYSNCRYCPFDSVCPVDRGEHAESKLDHPLVRIRELLVTDTLGGTDDPTTTDSDPDAAGADAP